MLLYINTQYQTDHDYNLHTTMWMKITVRLLTHQKTDFWHQLNKHKSLILQHWLTCGFVLHTMQMIFSKQTHRRKRNSLTGVTQLLKSCSQLKCHSYCQPGLPRITGKHRGLPLWYKSRNVQPGSFFLFPWLLTLMHDTKGISGDDLLWSSNILPRTFYLIELQYTDTGLTSPSADPVTAGVWQTGHLTTKF